MFVYNITNKVWPGAVQAWVQWQLEEHIPEIMATNLFTSYKFFYLLEQDEAEGVTYIIQYFFDDMNNYKKYVEEVAPALRQKALDRWGGQFIAFRTVMEEVL